MKVELKLHDQHGLKIFECDEVFYPTVDTVCFAHTKEGYIDTYFARDIARIRTHLEDYSNTNKGE